jgi:hypothetical protein
MAIVTKTRDAGRPAADADPTAAPALKDVPANMRQKVVDHASFAGISVADAAAKYREDRAKKAEPRRRGRGLITREYKLEVTAAEDRVLQRLKRAYGMCHVSQVLRSLAFSALADLEGARVPEDEPA